MKLAEAQKSSPSSSFLRLARKARPVAVAKAPKARAADGSSSPVLGRAWLPCLCLGSLTSEDDAEVDNEVLNDSLIEVETLTEAETLLEALADSEALVLTDSLSDVDSLVETEALVDSEVLNEPETDWLVEIEALVLCDSETDVETD